MTEKAPERNLVGVWTTPKGKEALDRISKTQGVWKSRVIENALLEYEKSYVESLD